MLRDIAFGLVLAVAALPSRPGAGEVDEWDEPAGADEARLTRTDIARDELLEVAVAIGPYDPVPLLQQKTAVLGLPHHRVEVEPGSEDQYVVWRASDDTCELTIGVHPSARGDRRTVAEVACERHGGWGEQTRQTLFRTGAPAPAGR